MQKVALSFDVDEYDDEEDDSGSGDGELSVSNSTQQESSQPLVGMLSCGFKHALQTLNSVCEICIWRGAVLE